MSNMTQDNKVTCPLCGKCVKISKTGKVSRHKSAYDYSGGSYYAGCSFSGNTLDTPLETLRSFVEAEVNGESVSKRELEVLDAALPVVETPVEETLQDKVNALPLKSFKVLAAVIPAMYDDESSCYLEDVSVEGMNIHAIAGTLPHLTEFITSENLAASKSGIDHQLTLEWGYDVYSLNTAIEARLNASVVETPVVETPVVETPVVETPVVETPVVETPVVETPVVETPAEEEARVIRVTPPQVDALRALGYEVRSCKLRYSPSQAEEILDSLYAERKLYTGAQRRVYTSIIDKVSQETKQAPSAALLPGDLRIEYRSFRAQRQILELIDAAERAGIVSRGSASTLRASVTPCINIVIR